MPKLENKYEKIVGEMNMIKNIIFDIGNVILNFNIKEVLQKFTSNKIEQKFILKNIINSPEWLGNALIDTGYISREDAIEIVKNRTNHCNDKLIVDFWKNYNDFAQVNTIETGNSMGIISKKVEPDDYYSIIKIIKEFNLIQGEI